MKIVFKKVCGNIFSGTKINLHSYNRWCIRLHFLDKMVNDITQKQYQPKQSVATAYKLHNPIAR
jgi:hypothetical protein